MVQKSLQESIFLFDSIVSETSLQVHGTNTDAVIPLVIVIPGLTSDSASPVSFLIL